MKVEKLDTKQVKSEKPVKKEKVTKKRKHGEDAYDTAQVNVSRFLPRLSSTLLYFAQQAIPLLCYTIEPAAEICRNRLLPL